MYDPICKFLAENYSQDFASWLLGEPLPLTQLSPKELSLEPIRADTLILLQSQKLLLHIEFQTRPDPDLPFRMLDYRIRGYRRFPHKMMRQVVIYLKRSRSELVRQTVFTIPHTRHEYEVIRLWEIPAEELMGLRGLLPLAPLGRTRDKTATLREVAQRIEGIENRREKSNVAAATSILAGLVLRKDIIQSLLREEIMRESVIYQDILARGEANEATKLILRQLNRRFGEIEPSLSEKVRALPVESLEQLAEALLDFSSVAELVAWLSEPNN